MSHGTSARRAPLRRRRVVALLAVALFPSGGESSYCHRSGGRWAYWRARFGDHLRLYAAACAARAAPRPPARSR